jgi:transcriptional regulator with XRE-family HTH domain
MQMLAPEVRSQFAKRLKQIRTQRGFPRARYFAKSLGIEENRYTRYERAEVEPSLTLIHKMCETLRVSPNELLGFVGLGDTDIRSAFAEPSAAELQPGEATSAQHTLSSIAWRLASEATAVRQGHDTKSKSARDPLQVFRKTGKLFQRLQAEPFGTVAEIVADESLKDADPARKAAIAELIASFTDSVAQAASEGARR